MAPQNHIPQKQKHGPDLAVPTLQHRRQHSGAAMAVGPSAGSSSGSETKEMHASKSNNSSSTPTTSSSSTSVSPSFSTLSLQQQQDSTQEIQSPQLAENSSSSPSAPSIPSTPSRPLHTPPARFFSRPYRRPILDPIAVNNANSTSTSNSGSSANSSHHLGHQSHLHPHHHSRVGVRSAFKQFALPAKMILFFSILNVIWPTIERILKVGVEFLVLVFSSYMACARKTDECYFLEPAGRRDDHQSRQPGTGADEGDDQGLLFVLVVQWILRLIVVGGVAGVLWFLKSQLQKLWPAYTPDAQWLTRIPGWNSFANLYAPWGHQQPLQPHQRQSSSSRSPGSRKSSLSSSPSPAASTQTSRHGRHQHQPSQQQHASPLSSPKASPSSRIGKGHIYQSGSSTSLSTSASNSKPSISTFHQPSDSRLVSRHARQSTHSTSNSDTEAQTDDPLSTSFKSATTTTALPASGHATSPESAAAPVESKVESLELESMTVSTIRTPTPTQSPSSTSETAPKEEQQPEIIVQEKDTDAALMPIVTDSHHNLKNNAPLQNSSAAKPPMPTSPIVITDNDDFISTESRRRRRARGQKPKASTSTSAKPAKASTSTVPTRGSESSLSLPARERSPSQETNIRRQGTKSTGQDGVGKNLPTRAGKEQKQASGILASTFQDHSNSNVHSLQALNTTSPVVRLKPSHKRSQSAQLPNALPWNIPETPKRLPGSNLNQVSFALDTEEPASSTPTSATSLPPIGLAVAEDRASALQRRSSSGALSSKRKQQALDLGQLDTSWYLPFRSSLDISLDAQHSSMQNWMGDNSEQLGYIKDRANRDSQEQTQQQRQQRAANMASFLASSSFFESSPRTPRIMPFSQNHVSHADGSSKDEAQQNGLVSMSDPPLFAGAEPESSTLHSSSAADYFGMGIDNSRRPSIESNPVESLLMGKTRMFGQDNSSSLSLSPFSDTSSPLGGMFLQPQQPQLQSQQAFQSLNHVRQSSESFLSNTWVPTTSSPLLSLSPVVSSPQPSMGAFPPVQTTSQTSPALSTLTTGTTGSSLSDFGNDFYGTSTHLRQQQQASRPAPPVFKNPWDPNHYLSREQYQTSHSSASSSSLLAGSGLTGTSTFPQYRSPTMNYSATMEGAGSTGLVGTGMSTSVAGQSSSIQGGLGSKQMGRVYSHGHTRSLSLDPKDAERQSKLLMAINMNTPLTTLATPVSTLPMTGHSHYNYSSGLGLGGTFDASPVPVTTALGVFETTGRAGEAMLTPVRSNSSGAGDVRHGRVPRSARLKAMHSAPIVTFADTSTTGSTSSRPVYLPQQHENDATGEQWQQQQQHQNL